jgi:hypothetical protein
MSLVLCLTSCPPIKCTFKRILLLAGLHCGARGHQRNAVTFDAREPTDPIAFWTTASAPRQYDSKQLHPFRRPVFNEDQRENWIERRLVQTWCSTQNTPPSIGTPGYNMLEVKYLKRGPDARRSGSAQAVILETAGPQDLKPGSKARSKKSLRKLT